MAEDDKPDDSSKTEDPTPKKLEEARKRGQVPQSRELNSWIMLLAATLIIAVGTPYMFSSLSGFLRIFLEQPHLLPQAPGGLTSILGETFFKTLGIVADDCGVFWAFCPSRHDVSARSHQTGS